MTSDTINTASTGLHLMAFNSDGSRRTNKRARLNTQKRTQAVLALTAAGLTKDQIAAKLGIGTTTVQVHRKKVKEAIQRVTDSEELMTQLQDKILELYPIERNAEDWVKLATSAKMETVKHASKQEINKIIGIIPAVERLRAKQSESGTNQPMFVLAPGCNVAVSFNTTSSKDASLHNTPTATDDLQVVVPHASTDRQSTHSPTDTSDDDTV